MDTDRMEGIPFNKSQTPHDALTAVIDWLGVNYEATITRKSDGSKIVVCLMDEDTHQKRKMMREAGDALATILDTSSEDVSTWPDEDEINSALQNWRNCFK